MTASIPTVRALNYDPADPEQMKLPIGQVCGNCFHFRRCHSIFGHTELDTYCDWSPSRFIPVTGGREPQQGRSAAAC